MIKFYLFSKKIHRLLVSVIVITSLTMIATGIFLKYPLINPFDPGVTRSLHNNLSIIFSVILFLMAASGLFMYLFPFLNKPKPKSV